MSRISKNILHTIGNTPLMEMRRLSKGDKTIFAKLESTNPGGSMKDRSSTQIVENLLRANTIRRGSTIIESSSGNMALGLAQVCKFYGLNLIVVVDPNLNPHVRKLLLAFGVRVDTVHEPFEEGGFLAARLHRVRELLTIVPDSHWTNQYGNRDNPDSYHLMMSEISDALPSFDYLFVATSTCGSLMGCADYIAEQKLSTKLIAVDAVGSVLFGGPDRKRCIPGHGAGVPSQFLDKSKVHDVVKVNDMECIIGCRLLLEKEAILGGGSMGGLVSAFGKYAHRIPENANSVMLFADRGERYLDTIYNENWVKENIGPLEIQPPEESFQCKYVEPTNLNHAL